MNRPVKVGVLCPFSTIYKSLSHDFIDGIKVGIPNNLRNQFEIVPEFIKQGQPSALRSAIEKLTLFDRVDVLTGVVGYQSIVELIPFLESNQKLSVFADMGEYLPWDHLKSDYLYFNSFQLWQAEYALGYWAQKEFGSRGKGSVFMSIYDCGYHMHSAFRQGAIAAGSSVIEYSTVRYSQDADYKVEKALLEYMERFRKEKPAFINAMFCGTEATDFFSVFHREGLHKEIPLIVSPHMGSREILNQIDNLDMEFYSASMWNYDSEDQLNRSFKEKYIAELGLEPNVYSLLGYEIGKLFEIGLPALSKRDLKESQKVFREASVKSPRGERCFYLDSEYALPTIDIEKILIANNGVRKMVVNQGKALHYNHEIYDEILREVSSGWLNAYLCV